VRYSAVGVEVRQCATVRLGLGLAVRYSAVGVGVSSALQCGWGSVPARAQSSDPPPREASGGQPWLGDDVGVIAQHTRGLCLEGDEDGRGKDIHDRGCHDTAARREGGVVSPLALLLPLFCFIALDNPNTGENCRWV